MTAIIFGASGQDGIFLSELLGSFGIRVVGVARSIGRWSQGDIADFSFVEKLVKEIRPKYVFHFAANSTTSHSSVFENHSTICTGTLNILESVRLHCLSAKVFLSGSAMQFENVGDPIDEKTPFEASSPYSVARIQSTYAGRYYRNKFGLQIYIGYFFNHDSQYRSERHINMHVATTAKKIATGSIKKLEIGNISVRKEFNYAGDVVSAIWKLVNQDSIYEVVIGSGVPYSIQNWIETCFKSIGKDWREFVVQLNNYTPEYDVLFCNPKMIRSLGWTPRVDFYHLAEIMMAAKI